jgi:hypothetical protein
MEMWEHGDKSLVCVVGREPKRVTKKSCAWAVSVRLLLRKALFAGLLDAGFTLGMPFSHEKRSDIFHRKVC